MPPDPASAKRTWRDRFRPKPLAAPQLLWRASRRWTTALVVALFPLLFILDKRTDAAFSPVLPGLVTLVALILAVPFLLTELFGRLHRKKEPTVRERKAVQLDQWGNLARIMAFLVFLAWLAWGS